MNLLRLRRLAGFFASINKLSNAAVNPTQINGYVDKERQNKYRNNYYCHKDQEH
jgi:hypothetical protein